MGGSHLELYKTVYHLASRMACRMDYQMECHCRTIWANNLILAASPTSSSTTSHLAATIRSINTNLKWAQQHSSSPLPCNT